MQITDPQCIIPPKYMNKIAFFLPEDKKATLDEYLKNGYRIIQDKYLLHTIGGNFHYEKDKDVEFTIPLRIDLKYFEFSRSQRQLLRKNDEKYKLSINKIIQPVSKKLEKLFNKHATEVLNLPNASIDSYLEFSAEHPMDCLMLTLKNKNNNSTDCSSFIHLGEKVVSSTYCFYEPEKRNDRLGIYSLLREIQYAIEQGYEYLYLGYTHSVPSAFDYKLNFEALEMMDWNDKQWYPIPRIPPYDWRPLNNNVQKKYSPWFVEFVYNDDYGKKFQKINYYKSEDWESLDPQKKAKRLMEIDLDITKRLLGPFPGTNLLL